MAEVTTVDGFHYSFAPAAVVAVTDHDVRGQAGTCVFGITPAWLKISEGAEDFLARIGLSADFVRLTRPDGSPIWLCAADVSSLRAPLPGEFADGVQSVLTAGGLTQGVTEDGATVAAAVDAKGGKL
jgi:hypothetical protein